MSKDKFLTIFLLRLCVVGFCLLCSVIAQTENSRAAPVEPAGATKAKVEKELRQQLLKEYDSSVIPTMNTTQVLDVRIEMLLTGIQEVDLAAQRLTISARLKLEWSDERLRWISSANGGILFLPFNQEDIYIPEITLFNSYAPVQNDIYAATMLVVYSHSEVVWMPGASLSVPCDMKMYNWPYDEHTCEFVFGHVSRDKNSLDLNPDASSIDLSQLVSQPADWQITKTGVRNASHYFNVGDNYDTVRFTVTLRRNAPLYLRSIYFAPHLFLLSSVLIFYIRDQNIRLLFGVLELFASVGFGICFYMVAPTPSETKAARMTAGFPMLVLTALGICELLDWVKNLKIAIPTLLKRNKHKTRRSSIENFFITGISTEELTQIHEPENEVNKSGKADLTFFTSILRVILFFLYCLTCFLLSLLTCLN